MILRVCPKCLKDGITWENFKLYTDSNGELVIVCSFCDLPYHTGLFYEEAKI